jgi:phytoene synthase
LFAIDDAMGDVVAKATEPALAAVKLAWWRERLQELDAGQVPAEPRLQAAATELLPRGIAGASLADLEEGWATLLEAVPDIERVGDRGAQLFAMASSLLGANDPHIHAAGRLYAMEGARRRGLLDRWPTQELNQLAGHRFVRELRPCTMLAALAARDSQRDWAAEHEGTPGRALTLLRHRFTGRFG